MRIKFLSVVFVSFAGCASSDSAKEAESDNVQAKSIVQVDASPGSPITVEGCSAIGSEDAGSPQVYEDPIIFDAGVRSELTNADAQIEVGSAFSTGCEYSVSTASFAN